MTTALIAWPVQAFVFAAGCALVHAGRAHTGALTRVLAGTAIVAATLLLLAVASLILPSGDDGRYDEVTVYGALASYPVRGLEAP